MNSLSKIKNRQSIIFPKNQQKTIKKIIIRKVIPSQIIIAIPQRILINEPDEEEEIKTKLCRFRGIYTSNFAL